MADTRRPVAPPRPMGVRSSSTERLPERPPSERSDTVPRSLSEHSVRLTTTELADLAEAAGRRAIAAWEREERQKGNELVRAQAAVLEVALDRDEARAKLEQTSAHLRRIDQRRDELESGRARLLYGIAALVLALATVLTERLTTGSVDAKAYEAAEIVVEERAAPIEQRAEAAAVTATTTDVRQTAAEARELAREQRLERLITALEKQAEPPPKPKRGGR
ncbi:MAG TPA: hypothetical protein VFG69_01630 [Nannocystaceae bacterium]|nr:hypothetical protein [Nannocystaceae bacterium]